MSIPACRKVEYTDDGCYMYQCLSCYKTWEARTNPERDGWNFCPYCGKGWEKHLDSDTKVYERKRARYRGKLDRDSEATLEVKHYEKRSSGDYACILDWQYVSYGISFHHNCWQRDTEDKDLSIIYREYKQQIKIANLIRELAKNYADRNEICDNFFMMTDGFELRVKIVSRITGNVKYILLTDGIEEVVRKKPKKYRLID